MKLSEKNEAILKAAVSRSRLLHTVIIESLSKTAREDAADYLCAWAMCQKEEKPCFDCVACEKVENGNHPDIIFAKPSANRKTKILSVEDWRENYLELAYHVPNDGDRLVFVFHDAETLLNVTMQNTLLKLIEEPPQDILFIFTCENARLLLETVRSRAQLIMLSPETDYSEEASELCDQLCDGIASLYELDLLKVCRSIDEKELMKEALTLLLEKLSLALRDLSASPVDDEKARMLSRKLDREKVLSLMEVTGDAIRKCNTNLSLSLIGTWLCSSYRRISWQK